MYHRCDIVYFAPSSTSPTIREVANLGVLFFQKEVKVGKGMLAEAQACYTLKPDVVKKLTAGTLKVEELEENHFILNLDQKGVDMKIGIDFVLDPMHTDIKPELFEHIDGLWSCFKIEKK